MIKKLFRNVTKTTYEPPVKHDGKQVEILRTLKPSEVDPEIGGMFLVCGVESGEEFHAYRDELFDEEARP